MTQSHYQYFTGKFEGHHKTVLSYQSWRPVFCEKAIVIVHGLGEHSGRYHNLVQSFLNEAVGIYGFDLRGHGRSKGQRGYVGSFLQLTNDLRQFLKLVSVHENNKPIYLFGHSLGGLICLRYLIECENKSGVVPAAAILTNPTLRIAVTVPKWKQTVSALFSRFFPRLALHNELDLHYLSHDPGVISEVMKDPYCHQRITLRFYQEILSTVDFVKKNCGVIRVPLLLLAGGEDGIVDFRGAEELCRGLELSRKKLKIYPTLYHELINEIGKEEVFSDMKLWLKELEGADL